MELLEEVVVVVYSNGSKRLYKPYRSVLYMYVFLIPKKNHTHTHRKIRSIIPINDLVCEYRLVAESNR